MTWGTHGLGGFVDRNKVHATMLYPSKGLYNFMAQFCLQYGIMSYEKCNIWLHCCKKYQDVQYRHLMGPR